MLNCSNNTIVRITRDDVESKRYTIAVFNTGAGSILEQLYYALPLPSVGCTVQWRISHRVPAVNIWRLFFTELKIRQQTS